MRQVLNVPAHPTRVQHEARIRSIRDVRHAIPETADSDRQSGGGGAGAQMHKAIEGSGSQRGRVTHQDLVFLVRKDERKYNRCVELLDMNEELKRARKVRRRPPRRPPIESTMLR